LSHDFFSIPAAKEFLKRQGILISFAIAEVFSVYFFPLRVAGE
jgi:hypothetical protein